MQEVHVRKTLIANRKAGLSQSASLIIMVMVGIAGCLALPTPTSAQTITFNFQATIIDAGGLSAFNVGETINGTYTFDATAPDLDGSPEVGSYETVMSLTMTTSGGYSVMATAASSKGLIEVQNDTENLTKDRYVLNVEEPFQALTGPSVDGRAPSFVTIVLRSSLTTALPSDALPLVPPSLADFDRDNSLILGFDCCSGVAMSAVLTSLTDTTPDPVSQIGALIAAVKILESDGTLNGGLVKALSSKLDGASNQLSDHPKAAAGFLRAFIEQVYALIRSGSMSAQEGESLIAAAEDIITGLSAQ
jgi:FIMAH domain